MSFRCRLRDMGSSPTSVCRLLLRSLRVTHGTAARAAHKCWGTSHKLQPPPALRKQDAASHPSATESSMSNSHIVVDEIIGQKFP